MKPNYAERTGPVLRTLRGDMTLREAAAKLDCDFTYLSKVECDTMYPSWDFLLKAFKLYKVSEDDRCMFAYWHLRRKHFAEFQLALRYISSSPHAADPAGLPR